MSFNPHRDGHKVWAYWHLMCANATSPRKRAFAVAWVNEQKEVFPCEECRKNLIRHLEELPVEPYGNTNVSLFLHSWKVHDTVNKMLKKSGEQCLTYEQAFAIYFPNHTGPGTAKPQQTGQHATASRQAPSQEQRNTVQKAVQPMTYERHLVAAGRQQPPSPEPTEHEHVHHCTTCNQEPPEFQKRNYQEYRQQKRRVYLPKN